MSTSVHTHTHTCTHYMHTEPSLTLDTLSSILEGTRNPDDLDDVGDWLQIPYSKQDELAHQYDRRHCQFPRTYSTIFLTDNPSPSWSTVALALWEAGEHGALEVVQKLYLKGEPYAHSYRSEGELVAAFIISYIVRQLVVCSAWPTWISIYRHGYYRKCQTQTGFQ